MSIVTTKSIWELPLYKFTAALKSGLSVNGLYNARVYGS